MINPNVEQLESLISAVVNNLYKEVPPTEDEFLEKATLLRNTNAPIMPVSDDEFAEIISRLKQSLVIQMDVGVYINDRNNGHQSWLPSKRADFDFFFWNRYKKYLEEIKHWNPRVTTNLGKVSDEILDLCGDPSEDTGGMRTDSRKHLRQINTGRHCRIHQHELFQSQEIIQAIHRNHHPSIHFTTKN